jgi:prepilin-type N-terminal cleavage/methylation domain-containing protein
MNMFKKMMIKQNHGFTLVELLIAVMVTIILLLAIYLAVNTTQRDGMIIERKVGVQADAKSALDIMALEIGMASYNANADHNDVWVVPAGNYNTPDTTNQKHRGIRIATANAITVQMDTNDSCNVAAPGNCIGDGPNEVIAYTYVIDDGGAGHITRNTNGGGAQPFLGDIVDSMQATPPRARNVRVNNAGADLAAPISLFRYFDGNGNELIPPDNPATVAAPNRVLDDATIPDIRRIIITLALQTADGDAFRYGERKQLFYSTSVIPRNHAINF